MLTTQDNCSTCKKWAQFMAHMGECRDRSPTLPANPVARFEGRIGKWPLTMAKSWCGQWQEKSNVPAKE